MTYEIAITGFADSADAIAHQDPIARLLCPEPEHNSPCEVPWGFTLTGDHTLVLGIYATPAKAAELTEAVHHLTTHETTLTESTTGNFDELAEQYRIEHPTQP
ncbi:hypothetical protein ACXJJ3_16415 [Kribbella sp. WER1]